MPPNVNLDSLAQLNADPAQYMAPMDLYDTIWGGKSTHEFHAQLTGLTDLEQNHQIPGTQA